MTELHTTATNHVLDGVPASSGIAIGPARIIRLDHTDELDLRLLEPEDVQLELERLRAALAAPIASCSMSRR